MKIGFTGTQHGMSGPQDNVLQAMLRAYTAQHDSIDHEFHHGDCIGADARAHMIARVCKMWIVLHPPISPRKRAFCRADYEEPLMPYLMRNQAIVHAVEVLIACPGQEREVLRSGTWATVRYARAAKKPTRIITPRGEVICQSNR